MLIVGTRVSMLVYIFCISGIQITLPGFLYPYPSMNYISYFKTDKKKNTKNENPTFPKNINIYASKEIYRCTALQNNEIDFQNTTKRGHIVNPGKRQFYTTVCTVQNVTWCSLQLDNT